MQPDELGRQLQPVLHEPEDALDGEQPDVSAQPEPVDDDLASSGQQMDDKSEQRKHDRQTQ